MIRAIVPVYVGERGDPIIPADTETGYPSVQGPRWRHQVRQAYTTLYSIQHTANSIQRRRSIVFPGMAVYE